MAVLSNGSQNLTYDLVDGIAYSLLPDYAEMRRKDPTNGKRPTSKPMRTLVNNTSFESARFRGESSGKITTQDLMRSPHTIDLNTLRRSTLSGSASAEAGGRIMRYYLPSWITLTKQPHPGGR